MFQVLRPRDGTSECQILITCNEPVQDPVTFLEVSDLAGSAIALKLTDVIYSCEGGLKVFLWWDDESGDTLILPLEGRGRLDLSPIGGIANPRNDGWTGHVQISTKGEGSFFLGLEFTKLQH